MKSIKKIILYIVLIFFILAIFLGSLFLEPYPAMSSEINIIITEFMSSNKSTLADENGDYPDWIELYNNGSSPVNLRGVGLSDSEDDPVKMRFPDYTLNPGEYLVVFASDKNKTVPKDGIFHAGFKLGKEDKTLVLSFGGKIIESISIPPLEADSSLARQAPDSSTWEVSTEPTPGFENTHEGYLRFAASKLHENSPLVINEFMPSNRSTLRDEDWEYPDWIEITNRGTYAINLEGYGITDDPKSPFKWSFPNMEIKPGEFLILLASGKDKKDSIKGMYHTSFKLREGESITLTSPEGKILDQVKILSTEPDCSIGRDANDLESFKTFTKPTPGYRNDGKGYNAFIESTPSSSPILLTEVLAQNNWKWKDEDGDYSDWVEIYNSSSKPVKLSDYYLTDDLNEPHKWQFPAASIDPGKYLLVYLSGKNKTSATTGQLHTSFKLDDSSESIYLTDSDRKVQDKLLAAGLPPGTSCGKSEGNKGYVIFETPTPNKENSSGLYDISPEVSFDYDGGFYEGELNLTITNIPQDSTVRYTLDGSEPNINSKVYTSPIKITKNTVVRARSYNKDCLPGPVKTSTYLISPRTNLPIVSISTAPANFWDEKSGLYTKGPGASSEFPYLGANFWKDIEKPIHIEFYETDGSKSLSMDAGIKIFGAYSRAMDQKSFTIVARKEYGKGSIDYQFFKNKPIYKFKNILLRTSGQDSVYSKIRDPMMTRLASDMGLDVQAYRPAVVYINGEYFGLYNIREKRDEHFIASNHNIDDPSSIDLLEANGRIKSGDNKDYKELINFVSRNDLRIAANYEYVESQIDIQNYINYHVAEMYFANTDSGNISYWRQNTEGGKWRWIVYDTDWGFYNVKHNTVAFALNPEGTGVGKYFSTKLITGLMKNPEFKERFLRTFAKELNTTLKPERVVSIIDEMAKVIEPEMPYQIERWGSSMKMWRSQIESLKDFARKRPGYLYDYIKSYFKLSDSQMKEYGFYK